MLKMFGAPSSGRSSRFWRRFLGLPDKKGFAFAGAMADKEVLKMMNPVNPVNPVLKSWLSDPCYPVLSVVENWFVNQDKLSLIKVNQGSRESYFFCRDSVSSTENRQVAVILCNLLVARGLDWFWVRCVKLASGVVKLSQDSSERGVIEGTHLTHRNIHERKHGGFRALQFDLCAAAAGGYAVDKCNLIQWTAHI